MRKTTKVYNHGSGRIGTMFIVFPTWGWNSDGDKVWRWLEQVSYSQTYIHGINGNHWSRYTWTDL